MPYKAVSILNNLGTILILLFITTFAIAFILNIVDKKVNLNEIFKTVKLICLIVAPASLLIGIVLFVFAHMF